MPVLFPAPPRMRGRLALLALAVAAASFALYFFSTGPDPFPGPPCAELVSRLGLDPLRPAVLDPLWGAAIRLLDRHFPSSFPWAANLFSAVCASLALAVFSLLAALLPYELSLIDAGGVLVRREQRARLVFGFASALYLASSVPFFVAATRSLPAAFHELLFMLAFAGTLLACRSPKVLPSLALGLFLGAVSVEFAPVYLLVAVFPAALARARIKAFEEDEPAPFLARIAAFLPAAAAGWAAALAWAASARAAAAGGFREAAFAHLAAQGGLFAALHLSVGLVLLFALAVVPAVYLFFLSPRSPGTFARAGILMRLILLAILSAVLFNAKVSPWRYLEMYLFLVTPYVLMALAAGELAGAFYLLGSRLFSGRNSHARWRWLATLVSFLATGAFAAAAWSNRPTARATDGAEAAAAARAVLATMRATGRDILLSSGVLDDHLRLLQHGESRAPGQAAPPRMFPVSLARLGSPDYAAAVMDGFAAAGIGAASGGHFALFVDGLLRSDEGRARVCTSDFETGLRGYGFLMPAGAAILLSGTREGRDWDPLLPFLRQTWDWWRNSAAHPPAETSLAFNLHNYLAGSASKNANDAGVLLAGDGRTAEAAEAFRAALDIRPGNVAAAYNLVALAGLPGGAEAAGDREEALARAEELAADAPRGDLYACSARYGYLLSAQPFARKRLWMYTGIVRDAENAFHAQAGRDRLERTSRLARLVRGAHYDDPGTFVPAHIHFQKLIRAGDTAETLLRLARLAIAAGDTDEAADFLAVARARGAGAEDLALDRALLDYARGDTVRALAGLKRLIRTTYGNLRAWLALATIAPSGSRTYRACMEQIDRKKDDSVPLLSAAANLRIVHGRLEEARADVNRWLELSPHALDAWELLIELDDQQQDGKRLDEHLQMLLRFAPDHPYRFVGIGNEAVAQGDWAQAEAAWRRALQDGRLPTLLVRLGQVLRLRGGDTRLEEALSLADEALAKIPDHAEGRLLRARVLADLGRWEEAREETDAFLAFQPENAAGRLVRARCRYQAGDLRGAGEDIRFLTPRKTQLEKRDVRTLRLLRTALVEKVQALRAARDGAGAAPAAQ